MDTKDTELQNKKASQSEGEEVAGLDRFSQIATLKTRVRQEYLKNRHPNKKPETEVVQIVDIP